MSSRLVRHEPQQSIRRQRDIWFDAIALGGGRVAECVIGFSIANSSPALSPSPSSANAITAQATPCVYCPPFSRTPGT